MYLPNFLTDLICMFSRTACKSPMKNIQFCNDFGYFVFTNLMNIIYPHTKIQSTCLMSLTISLGVIYLTLYPVIHNLSNKKYHSAAACSSINSFICLSVFLSVRAYLPCSSCLIFMKYAQYVRYLGLSTE